MGSCNISFTEAGAPSAYKVYQTLIADGVSCEAMDVGDAPSTYGAEQCPIEGDMSCIIGRGDGIVTAPEVFEYAIRNYEKYQRVIEGTVKKRIPWALDDLDPNTNFDARIRAKIQSAIDEIRKILAKKKIKEGTDEFREAMAVGVFIYIATKDVNAQVKDSNGEKFMSELFSELDAVNLHEFRRFLLKHGGLRPEDGSIASFTALETLENNTPDQMFLNCVLFAAFRMAGFDPVFVEFDLTSIDLDRQTFPMHRKLLETVQLFAQNNDIKVFKCIGLDVGDRMRYFEASTIASDLTFDKSIIMSPAGEMNNILNVIAHAMTKAGKHDKAVEYLTAALQLHPFSALLHYRRGSAYFSQLKTDAAIADFTRAIELNKSNKPWIDPYLDRGEAYEGKGVIDKAIADYKEAKRIMPDDKVAYLRMIQIHSRQGIYSDMISAMSEYFLKFNAENAMACADAISDELQLKWELADELKAESAVAIFEKETGVLSLAKVEAFIITSYALWKSNFMAESARMFEHTLDAIEFKVDPSPSTKAFFMKILDAMPHAMADEPLVQEMIGNLKKKLERRRE